MKGLNISSFKKVKVEKDHTLMEHKDGHQIKIAHKGLSKQMKKQLDALPMYEGGEVDSEDTPGRRERTRVDAARASIPRNYAEPTQGDRQLIDRYASGGEVYPTCKNPSCKSYGRSHPNCRCGNGMADGGVAYMKENYCMDCKPHTKGCEYFAEGGPVQIDPDKAKEVQDAMRKAFHFSDGGNLSPEEFDKHLSDLKAQGYKVGDDTPMSEQPVNASKLESQYSAEDAKASPPPQQPPQPNLQDLSAQAVQSQAALAQSQAQITQALSQHAQPPQQQQPQQAPQQPTMDPTPNVPNSNGNLLGQLQTDLKGQDVAEANMAKNSAAAQQEQAGIYGKSADDMQALHQEYQARGQHIIQKYDALANEVANGKVDPNHFFNSKSTGSKILTAIGMLFSGAGMGAAGKPELATKYIDDAIDRDIDTQKSNLQNKNNLLSKYMDLYRSLPEAEAAARLTLHAGVEGLINQQAAKLGSQNALQAAEQSKFARREKALPMVGELLKTQMIMGALSPDKGGAAPNSEAAYQRKLNVYQMAMPDRYKQETEKYLPGVGVAAVPVPEKLRQELPMRKDLSDKLAKLELFAKEHQGTIADRATVTRGETMAKDVQDAFRSARGQGVFREAESKFVNGIIDEDPTKFFANVRTLPKYRTIRESNDSTLKQIYKSYGVKPFESQEQGGSNEAAKQWLKANPNDPRAKAIRQKLGM